ncbi:MAG: hypothetical protein PHE83_17445 [Opitutaceae bacterium]|nr:hypothetical protein [Opitutaceae bacterium]
MKYFVAGAKPNERTFSGVRALRSYLASHPEIATVTRHWWCGNDLIDCVEIPRADILQKPATDLKRGQTAQWACDHGNFPARPAPPSNRPAPS